MTSNVGIWRHAVLQVVAFGRMVGFSHSISVLPFALAAVVLAKSTSSQPVSRTRVLWVTVAVLSCRSAALGFNRLADMHWDRLNPRTRNWALPRGLISPRTVVFFVLLSAVVFFAAMGALSLACLYMSPIVLSVAFFHAFTKRFTWTSHFFLGVVYAMAPIVAWIAMRGDLRPSILVLGAVMAAWGAGFDIICACQDHGFDREWRLYSIPQTFGITKALWISGALHGLSLLGMIALKWFFALNVFYVLGVSLVGVFLLWGHIMAQPKATTNPRTAFFEASGLISVFYFVSVAGGTTPAALGG